MADPKQSKEEQWTDDIPDPEEERPEPYEETYPDGSAKHECWAGDLLCALIAVLMLLFHGTVSAETAPWDCPTCGYAANTGNFCPECGTGRPMDEVIEGLTQIPGEANRVRVDVLRIDGSDYVRDSKDPYRYAPEKALDSDEMTCWKFSVKNIAKKAPWLSLIIEGQTVDELWLKNGIRTVSGKGVAQYPLYARPKEIEVQISYMDDREADVLTLTLPDSDSGDWERLDIGRHEQVYDLWITVLSVYPGSSKPTSACLAEIMPVQRASSTAAKEPWW